MVLAVQRGPVGTLIPRATMRKCLVLRLTIPGGDRKGLSLGGGACTSTAFECCGWGHADDVDDYLEEGADSPCVYISVLGSLHIVGSIGK